MTLTSIGTVQFIEGGIQNELAGMMPCACTCVGEPRAVVGLELCQAHHFSLHQEDTLTSQGSVFT